MWRVKNQGETQAMAELQRFMFPKSPAGKASIVPPPPWHYSADVLAIEYRTDPDRVAELLPDPLQPDDSDPGAVSIAMESQFRTS